MIMYNQMANCCNFTTEKRKAPVIKLMTERIYKGLPDGIDYHLLVTRLHRYVTFCQVTPNTIVSLASFIWRDGDGFDSQQCKQLHTFFDWQASLFWLVWLRLLLAISGATSSSLVRNKKAKCYQHLALICFKFFFVKSHTSLTFGVTSTFSRQAPCMGKGVMCPAAICI